MRGVLLRYRVMAFTTAALLIVLVFVGIPLQVAAGRPQVVNDVGTMHGFLYIVYLVVAFQLTRRLGIPKWQMLLVLLAGTVPFCAFVAERKMTRRFEALAATGPPAPHAGGEDAPGSVPAVRRRAVELRQRWLSPRALVLHIEVLVVAPGCALAGWWQATRALGGNELSWVYSIEWPIFALIALYGWWHLVHEDPEAYRARRLRGGKATETADSVPEASVALPSLVSTHVEAVAGIGAAVLAALTVLEILVGVVSLVLVPFDRPSSWVPAHGAVIYGVHATLGLLLGIGALGYLVMVHAMGRIARIAGWTGLVGVFLASVGGLLTVPDSIVRFLGIALMLVGSALAIFGYSVAVVLRARTAAVPDVGAVPDVAAGPAAPAAEREPLPT